MLDAQPYSESQLVELLVYELITFTHLGLLIYYSLKNCSDHKLK